ncbi:MarR family winged helix-turn-helix transcriptional regulator [Streptomyces sp. CB02261]|uniref:MarR family winged helix-turn-helix transcriptional regulator n=1 Tax=Streptomyces sp. CB02261 TaxID=1703940 RepID=UPI000A4985C7|nr:MarR family winged helix-turn-helix transcriptional regulator [Streptomyces sp. CB02261]
MDQPVVSGVAHDLSGATFAVVGISSVPTDWAKVFRSLANTELTLDPLPGAGPTAPALTPPSRTMTPPSVLELNAYLMYTVGRAARRRLAERLEARGLRLWHLTVMALLADLGPQMKTVIATRLAMNASDLGKIVNDLVRVGQADCVRDPADRRRVVVRLTPEGEESLRTLSAEIASVDDEILAPLDTGEREQLASLLRRVHGHLEPAAPAPGRERKGPPA